jgi:hypothetical protein
VFGSVTVSSSSNDDDLSDGEIAGIVIGCVAAAALIFVLVVKGFGLAAKRRAPAVPTLAQTAGETRPGARTIESEYEYDSDTGSDYTYA